MKMSAVILGGLSVHVLQPVDVSSKHLESVFIVESGEFWQNKPSSSCFEASKSVGPHVYTPFCSQVLLANLYEVVGE